MLYAWLAQAPPQSVGDTGFDACGRLTTVTQGAGCRGALLHLQRGPLTQNNPPAQHRQCAGRNNGHRCTAQLSVHSTAHQHKRSARGLTSARHTAQLQPFWPIIVVSVNRGEACSAATTQWRSLHEVSQL
eukprot:1138614-Pelagomonas_calceolata.AAC.3